MFLLNPKIINYIHTSRIAPVQNPYTGGIPLNPQNLRPTHIHIGIHAPHNGRKPPRIHKIDPILIQRLLVLSHTIRIFPIIIFLISISISLASTSRSFPVSMVPDLIRVLEISSV